MGAVVDVEETAQRLANSRHADHFSRSDAGRPARQAMSAKPRLERGRCADLVLPLLVVDRVDKVLHQLEPSWGGDAFGGLRHGGHGFLPTSIYPLPVTRSNPLGTPASRVDRLP